MPLYTFETKSGELREHHFWMQDRPLIGRWRKIDGEWCRRIVEPAPCGATVKEYRHVSRALPRKGTGIEKVWDKFTEDGKPYFTSKQDVADLSARSNGVYKHDTGAWED